MLYRLRNIGNRINYYYTRILTLLFIIAIEDNIDKGSLFRVIGSNVLSIISYSSRVVLVLSTNTKLAIYLIKGTRLSSIITF